ncbi:uncharacterized protein AKAW2_30066A [Aspergillus luchuensis]|uniref:Uncharacterized protein n=2 Tax=Aspergillus kawachii TaxID=1069201 RepID=A0A7R7W5I0_ASPKA|nr:uncharacterized protein AKAW2_30066A [Aspergillus luchuensis]OJZ87903.1 hypothetical protein ASPFODRAFT_715934 [Aspergillus luchuensis CBS 106.47]BCR96747.1 hypothetical protein AKAW2_30066A [Aspergillus luchuensis]BCS09241.1 hypothetical protein ALUC_30058A [Aspergillus luchuensis]GAA91086.1 hypothetical protein AKAW_09200 [Aspergillus luchuensis IFO 4308]
MARNRNIPRRGRLQWSAQIYQDHASQPAALLVYKATTPEPEATYPAFAIQVYTTVALDQEDDLIAICRYLSREISTLPGPSFEIYSTPQTDVFACVEHQRREIFHRKAISPSRDDGLSPGIAKVALSREDPQLQGVIFVIMSYSFRDYPHYPDDEAETGPLFVKFDRCFPYQARVDLPSPKPDDDEGWEEEIWPEREHLVVRKCRNIYHVRRELASLHIRSQRDDVVEDYVYDYGLGEDEGDPNRSVEPPTPDIVEEWQRRADSLPKEIAVVQPSSDNGVVVMTSGAITTSDPELRYIIYVTFAHRIENHLTLQTIGRAFTAAILENVPGQKTVHFEFHSVPNSSLGAALSSHRELMKSRPEVGVAVSRPTSGQRARKFPQKGYNRGHPSDREPYQTFFVVLDRPDFLTGPGVLFFLADGDEITDEAMQNVYNLYGEPNQPRDYAMFRVWRSVGIQEVARRLAMVY